MLNKLTNTNNFNFT